MVNPYAPPQAQTDVVVVDDPGFFSLRARLFFRALFYLFVVPVVAFFAIAWVIIANGG